MKKETLNTAVSEVNESKPTPGPWFSSPQNKYVRANGIHGWNIATVEDQPPYTEANARLIAAAPDMLEALKEIVKMTEGFSQLGMNPITKCAKAAIARATNNQ